MLDTLSRLLLTVLLALALAGFGALGATGTLNGVIGFGTWGQDQHARALELTLYGLAGLLIAWGCGAGVVRIWRGQRPFDR